MILTSLPRSKVSSVGLVSALVLFTMIMILLSSSGDSSNENSVPASPSYEASAQFSKHEINYPTVESTQNQIESIKAAAEAAHAKWPRALNRNMTQNKKFLLAQFINYQLPTWLCPNEERIGGYDDGGKWVCAARTLLKSDAPCYIYSFGSNLQTEFEESLSRIRNCEIHIFDPTPSLQDKVKQVKLPSHIHFHSAAFGGAINKNITIENVQFLSKTLDEWVGELKTPHIDILKIDVEYSEWNQIFRTDKDSIWQKNKIGQILIEIHLDFTRYDHFESMFKLFDGFTKAGFILFHSEWNINGIGAWEFSFINLDYTPKLHGRTSIQRILMEPYNEATEKAVRLSDKGWHAHFFSYYNGWFYQRNFNFIEATYHCSKKVFIGDRINMRTHFMYLCLNFLPQDALYVGLYDTKATLTASSVEPSLKTAYHNYIVKTDTFVQITRDAVLFKLSEMLKQADIVKLDVPTSHLLDWTALEAEHVLVDAKASIIHAELHLCDIPSNELRGKLINMITWFTVFGYEVYHKEVTFKDNLILEETVGFDQEKNQICHMAVSWIKLI